jgi:hypothetical protein
MRSEMFTWQIGVLFVMAAGTIGCLLGILRSIQKLTKSMFSIGAELTKINSKLESIETVGRDDAEKPTDECEPGLEALEAAISNFEKLKRIDLGVQQGNKR